MVAINKFVKQQTAVLLTLITICFGLQAITSCSSVEEPELLAQEESKDSSSSSESIRNVSSSSLPLGDEWCVIGTSCLSVTVEICNAVGMQVSSCVTESSSSTTLSSESVSSSSVTTSTYSSSSSDIATVSSSSISSNSSSSSTTASSSSEGVSSSSVATGTSSSSSAGIATVCNIDKFCSGAITQWNQTSINDVQTSYDRCFFTKDISNWNVGSGISINGEAPKNNNCPYISSCEEVLGSKVDEGYYIRLSANTWIGEVIMSADTPPSCGSSVCGNRTESYDPNVYKCEGNKIYLKTSVSYGGESYDAVLIGNDTWMTRNLNYSVSSSSGSVCHGDNPANCNIYGRLYDWATAMSLSTSCNSSTCTVNAKHQGICPTGWHIPSQAEWNTLLTKGIVNLTASSWSGEDIYGFAALPGGDYTLGDAINPPSYNHLGAAGEWWSSGQNGNGGAYSYNIIETTSNSYGNGKTALHSVRCVKD